MPKSCAAKLCCNRYSSRRKQLTFHRFPFSRPELLKEWVLNIGRTNFKPKQHTVICSEHFRPECFSAFGNRKNLKHNAVPTVFAFQNPTQVCPEVGAGGDRALEEFQSPDTEGPVKQVLPEEAEAMEAPGLPASSTGLKRPPLGQPSDHSSTGLKRPPLGQPSDHSSTGLKRPPLGQPSDHSSTGLKRPPLGQPSDHSYALLDLDTLKKKLFLTLKENQRLRKRLRAQRLLLQRTCSRLRAYREGQRGPRAAQPAQQS